LLLRELLAPGGALAVLGAPSAVRPATIALTGFIVWCDWMGSNERDFPAAPQVTPEQYVAQARVRAAAALATHGLHGTRPTPTYPGFAALFPTPLPPRPLQVAIDGLLAEGLERPGLTIIEAPTGEGKTEAALALARRIAAAHTSDELFFALPTMATGNQMFLRLQRFYDQQYGREGAVRLTHSQALVVEDDLRRRLALAPDGDRADPDGSSEAVALEWFVGPKKAMLAPFGVGTVDQVELGGLNVRHYPLRLFGLAGKVVIIDEVHAYDAYMSTILDHTLTWLASLGCSTILLSATLPQERHRALAAAFLAGLGESAPAEVPGEMPYPLIARYSAGPQHHESCAVFRGEQRFTLRLARQRTPSEEAAYLLELVHDGGAVARLCNRVDDAQALYAELIARGVPPESRVLLHARFPLHERQAREQRVEQLLGKATARSAAQPLIVVGTQVLEQSLDYDVDVMVSDFAPIDLLLQRAGRLHRHDRAGRRPPRHEAPVLEVTLPEAEQGAPDWRRWAPIYEPYILWRTWATLRATMGDGAREIVLPRDYRPLIETVYAAEGGSAGPHAEAIARARAHYRRSLDEQGAKARRPLIPDATTNAPITENGGRTFIEDESGEATGWQLAKTRLGDRITLVPLYRGHGELSLDAGGTVRLSPDVVPDLEQLKMILAYAVMVSDRRVIAAYRDERRPRELRWPWSDRELPPLLRSAHPLPLNQNTHSVTLDDCTLRLDRELGLVIESAHGPAARTIEEEL
ncbi:MAG TPA: CRISPR-associated helicase Cas3', partial [Chloroflexaceae bacterium]|nr:CRISPR-associated helicase Cas3' [Chloroflexaceae bacterium]